MSCPPSTMERETPKSSIYQFLWKKVSTAIGRQEAVSTSMDQPDGDVAVRTTSAGLTRSNNPTVSCVAKSTLNQNRRTSSSLSAQPSDSNGGESCLTCIDKDNELVTSTFSDGDNDAWSSYFSPSGSLDGSETFDSFLTPTSTDNGSDEPFSKQVLLAGASRGTDPPSTQKATPSRPHDVVGRELGDPTLSSSVIYSTPPDSASSQAMTIGKQDADVDDDDVAPQSHPSGRAEDDSPFEWYVSPASSEEDGSDYKQENEKSSHSWQSPMRPSDLEYEVEVSKASDEKSENTELSLTLVSPKYLPSTARTLAYINASESNDNGAGVLDENEISTSTTVTASASSPFVGLGNSTMAGPSFRLDNESSFPSPVADSTSDSGKQVKSLPFTINTTTQQDSQPSHLLSNATFGLDASRESRCSQRLVVAPEVPRNEVPDREYERSALLSLKAPNPTTLAPSWQSHAPAHRDIRPGDDGTKASPTRGLGIPASWHAIAQSPSLAQCDNKSALSRCPRQALARQDSTSTSCDDATSFDSCDKKESQHSQGALIEAAVAMEVVSPAGRPQSQYNSTSVPSDANVESSFPAQAQSETSNSIVVAQTGYETSDKKVSPLQMLKSSCSFADCENGVLNWDVATGAVSPLTRHAPSRQDTPLQDNSDTLDSRDEKEYGSNQEAYAMNSPFERVSSHHDTTSTAPSGAHAESANKAEDQTIGDVNESSNLKGLAETGRDDGAEQAANSLELGDVNESSNLKGLAETGRDDGADQAANSLELECSHCFADCEDRVLDTAVASRAAPPPPQNSIAPVQDDAKEYAAEQEALTEAARTLLSLFSKARSHRDATSTEPSDADAELPGPTQARANMSTLKAVNGTGRDDVDKGSPSPQLESCRTLADCDDAALNTATAVRAESPCPLQASSRKDSTSPFRDDGISFVSYDDEESTADNSLSRFGGSVSHATGTTVHGGATSAASDNHVANAAARHHANATSSSSMVHPNDTATSRHDSTADSDEAAYQKWRQDFLPRLREDAVASATVFDAIGIWGPQVFDWAQTVLKTAWFWRRETNGGWKAVIQAILCAARDKRPSKLGTAATTEWTTIELELLQRIKCGNRDVALRSQNGKTFLIHELSHVLILHFFRLLCVEWHDGSVIPHSMATLEQSLTRTASAALCVPLIIRQRFLAVFATQKLTGDYVMMTSDKVRCHIHILILYLNCHWQFDVDRDDVSTAPLEADFTQFVMELGITLKRARVFLDVAGCKTTQSSRGTVTATLDSQPSYPAAALVKKASGLCVDWGASSKSTEIPATHYDRFVGPKSTLLIDADAKSSNPDLAPANGDDHEMSTSKVVADTVYEDDDESNKKAPAQKSFHSFVDWENTALDPAVSATSLLPCPCLEPSRLQDSTWPLQDDASTVDSCDEKEAATDQYDGTDLVPALNFPSSFGQCPSLNDSTPIAPSEADVESSYPEQGQANGDENDRSNLKVASAKSVQRSPYPTRRRLCALRNLDTNQGEKEVVVLSGKDEASGDEAYGEQGQANGDENDTSNLKVASAKSVQRSPYPTRRRLCALRNLGTNQGEMEVVLTGKDESFVDEATDVDFSSEEEASVDASTVHGKRSKLPRKMPHMDKDEYNQHRNERCIENQDQSTPPQNTNFPRVYPSNGGVWPVGWIWYTRKSGRVCFKYIFQSGTWEGDCTKALTYAEVEEYEKKYGPL